MLKFLDQLADRVAILVEDIDGSQDACQERMKFDSADDKARMFPAAVSQGTAYPELGANIEYFGAVNINKALVEDVRNWDAPGRAIEETRLKSVTMAATICHELTHATFGFLIGNDTSWFFNDEIASETGLAYETFTFGRILRQDTDKTRLYLESWPSLDIWTSYADGEGSRNIGIRDPYDEMSLDAGTKSYVPDED